MSSTQTNGDAASPTAQGPAPSAADHGSSSAMTQEPPSSAAQQQQRPQQQQQPPPPCTQSPEQPSFTSFPEGEGSMNPDIPAEPMLNKLYNRVLSLANSGKSPAPLSSSGPPSSAPSEIPSPVTTEFKTKIPETTMTTATTGLGIPRGATTLQSKTGSLSSLGPGTVEAPALSLSPNPTSTTETTNSNRLSSIRPVEKNSDVLLPVVSAVHALGGLTRSEDGFSMDGGSEKGAVGTSESTKSVPLRAHLREITLPGLAGFRLTREPSSDSESVSSYSTHPARTAVKTIIGRLKSGDLGREFWMKDESSRECFSCGEKFTTFRRKHHCRICGRIFDDKCTSHMPGSRFGLQEKIRVCNSCKNIMDEYDDLEAQETNESAQLAPVSLNVVPPDQLSDTGGQPSPLLPDSPRTAYALPHGQRPGTVPQIAIPATRTAIGTSGRHTAVEIPTLDVPSSRPPSSRSNTGIQIGRRRSQSFGASLGPGRPRSNSTPMDEVYSEAPFHQNNMNDDEMGMFHDVTAGGAGDPDESVDDLSGEESYASISASREGFLDSPTIESISEKDHLKPPTPIQRHRSITKAAFDEKLRTSKRRSLQSIQRRSRSKSRGHRSSTSIVDLQPPSPATSLHPPHSQTQTVVAPSSPANLASDLNQSSILHVQKLLTQMLVEEEIPNADTWQRVLMPILLKIADTLNPDVRAGDDIDVRAYVKIKRLPGATEAETTYVSGVVFTKNLAYKRMARTVHNPRIMLITFPVEYHHNGEMQLMSLDPMISQGKEYIRNLVSRIVSHKPTVLVIGNSVSGVALDYLLETNVSTLYNVKPSVIEALSRCCEADIISSIDKLSSNPALGNCGLFSVRTSIHSLIPGEKKTLVYLNGCPSELGCTIVLRGADMMTLGKVKRVLDFMIYVVYNLKLETSLMYDNLINIPDLTGDSAEKDGGGKDEVASSDSTVYDAVIKEFRRRILSTSPCVRFPPPELLLKARNAEIQANRYRQEHEKAKEEERDRRAHQEKVNEGVKATENFDPEKPPDSERQPREKDPVAVCSTDESYQRRVDNLLHEYRHNRAITELALRHRQWENFQQLSPELMNPLAHQNIIVLYGNLQKKTSVPCQGPDIHVIDFYSENDCALGQYVEDLFLHKEVQCEECEKFQYDHVRNYVHYHGRMNVFVEQMPCPLPGMQQSILMWSWCSVCELTLNVSRISENSYRYSFGKWLELAFYAKGLKHRGGSCPHDINRYHVRYFGYDNWAVRFQYDTVDVLSLVVPDMRLTWQPDVDVRLKNAERDAIAGKVNRFFDSVTDRLKSINLETIAADKQEHFKAEIQLALEKAQSQRESSLQSLAKIWHESMVLDRLPLNRVLKDVQDHVVSWDTQFAEFERNYMPTDKDIRRLTAMQLRKLVGDTSLPFMDVLDRKSSTPSEAPSIVEGTAPAIEPLNEPNPNADNVQDEDIGTSPESVDSIQQVESSSAIDVPIIRSEETSPSILPSSVDSRLSEISETEPERRTSGPKTLSVAPKIARLQAEIISPSTSPMRKSSVAPTSAGLTPTISPPQGPTGRSRNISAQSSESDDIPDFRKEGRSTRRPTMRPTKIPKGRPPQPLASIHAKSAGGDASDSSHKLRGSSDEKAGRGKHKQPFMANTIKKLQRVAGSQSVSSLAKHFDELSRQYEKEEIKRRKRFGYRRALPVTSAKPKVEVFSNVQDIYQEASDDELVTELEATNSTNHSRKSTLKGPEEVPSEAMKDHQEAGEEPTAQDRPQEAHDNNVAASPAAVVAEIIDDSIQQTQEPGIVAATGETQTIPPEDAKESVSLMKAITNLWADRSAALWKPLEYPLQSSAHVFSDSDVIVREDEPSSLIAFTLSSQDYELKLKGLKNLENTSAVTPSSSNPAGTPNINASQDPSAANDIEAALLKSTGTHMKYQFQEGSANFVCKIFYAEQFDALRINCGCDEHYIQSLSRCVKWDSSGGKSKSAFLKTLDDRLVVKQMSRYEMDAFVKFAPAYFEYMSQAFFHELPTVLAKILGFYQIGSKNPVTGKTMKMDVLVMENLFYKRNTTRIFDLKGSMRNRHVQSTGKANEVLLDENLVEFIYESPLFVGQHSKRVLRHSLWNDTLFLAKMNVMDYSLVIGIDEEHRDLILGIIDFIRTFTWDKKLESWVKERGFVGGGTKEPTIVTPRQYKNRFRASMERYFLQVPNCYSIHDIRRA